jgi:hypothetical protein
MTRSERRARRLADRYGYGDDNIVPDGTVLRVPLTMMDSIMDGLPRKPLTFRDVVSDGGDTRDARRQERQARQAARRAASDSGSAEAARLATEAMVETLRKTQLMSHDGYSQDALHLHKPGYRVIDDAAIDLFAGERARAERILHDSNAWRGDGSTEAAGPTQVEGAQSPRGILPVGALRPSPTQRAGMSCSHAPPCHPLVWWRRER